MDLVDLILGLLFAAFGVGGLLSASLIPSLQTFWPYRTRLYLGKLPESHRNRTIASVWLIGAGLYVAFSDQLEGNLRYLAFAAFFALTLLYIFIRDPAPAGS